MKFDTINKDVRSEIALSASGLRVETASGHRIINDVSFNIGKGEILGVVGESGSGKTTSALAVLGMAHPGAHVSGGVITVKGRLVQLSNPKETALLRGRYISYVPQSPGTALNPSMRIEAALKEMQRRSPGSRQLGRAESSSLIGLALEKVDLPRDRDFIRRFPHQLSGGQQQRICIAMALLSGAEVIILDEPTTGLDVITQRSVINELKRLREDLGLSMLYISHDLAVVSQLADRVAVMYSGSIVELGSVKEVLRSPAHPYTRCLLESTLDFRKSREIRPMPSARVQSTPHGGCAFEPRCPVAQDECREQVPSLRQHGDNAAHAICCHHPVESQLETLSTVREQLSRSQQRPIISVDKLTIEHVNHGKVVASVNDVSFQFRPGECLALLGQSGSGKSTIARTVIGLKPPTSGAVRLDGITLAPLSAQRTVEQRRRIQMVFQNSTAALNPRETVSVAIQRARSNSGQLKVGGGNTIGDLLELVRLPESVRHRFPRELSGGERQRVCIARALASSPEVLVCDEITSALDVSVQASILRLMKDLQRDLGLAMLFITHDMGVVNYLADHVVVLDHGRLCESGPTTNVIHSPQSAYAQRLVEAVPSL
jgi:peptide/nickel transport system ATP-binding protein